MTRDLLKGILYDREGAKIVTRCGNVYTQVSSWYFTNTDYSHKNISLDCYNDNLKRTSLSISGYSMSDLDIIEVI